LRKYESGNIAAKTWPLDQLPDEEALVNVLITFVDLYVETVAERDRLKMLGAGGVTLPAREVGVTSRVRERRFEPKDASDYRAHIGAQEHSRSRSHELLVKRLGEWAITRGFEPNTNVHPRDLVLHGDAVDLLVEVKVFAPGRPSQAVRECIGQLYEYRAFLGSPRDVLIAALSANPGLAYLELLQDMSICVIWPQQGGWCGTESAVNLGLADHF
jgi:hypothetical protein